MRAKKLNTEIRREQIAQEALKLVAAEGLEALSMAALAERVGVVPSGIYRHFAGKDQVLDAMLDLIGRKLDDNVRSAMQESDEVRQLRNLLDRHGQMLRENPGIPRLVFSPNACAGHPERRQKLHRIIRAYLDHVAGILRQGQRRGIIRDDADAGTLALLFLGVVQPAAFLWHISGGKLDVVEHVRQAGGIFLQAVSTEGDQYDTANANVGAVPGSAAGDDRHSGAGNGALRRPRRARGDRGPKRAGRG